MKALKECRLGIVGLGYVGLPLAVKFAAHLDTVGFDIYEERIAELRQGLDRSQETEPGELAAAERLTYTHREAELRGCDVYVVAVPTPVDQHKQPDLFPLLAASRAVGRVMAPGAVVIFESTVFPGATEEVCVPALEEVSGLKLNEGFFVGYSPERINPGDKVHTLTNTVKVTSGSTPEVAEFVDRLYGLIIEAGTFRASTIRVAEAAKVIENTQRDVNIALVNELALIFERLGVDTMEVLEAAGSKWNFLPFRPGLVGGHCIGVDPYYLTHKAQEAGYQPSIIPASRLINESMGLHVAGRVVKLMAGRGIQIVGSRILVMGLTFKENCPDLRNTKVVDIISELQSYNANVEVFDPWADRAEARAEYGVEPVEAPSPSSYDAIVVAVAHGAFREMGIEAIRALGRENSVLFDVKYLFEKDEVDGRL